MLLATLLLHANVPVSADALIDVLWPDRPPPSALANLRTYAHLLRGRLVDNDSHRIESRAGGYVLTAEPNELDFAEFEDRVSRARQRLSQGDQHQALPLLQEAARLWRGRVLEDLPHCPAWQPTLARLEELRLSVIEQRLGLRITCGEFAEVVAELRGLLTDHPLREELWRLLMLALTSSGRTAEALRVYADAERVLSAELGTTPGRELRLTREKVLAELNGHPVPVVPASSGPRPFPVCQLPLDLPDFTGRERDVRLLTELCGSAAAGTPTVAVLTGQAGVGKSALAVHIAHRLREMFADGQLYVDLKGSGVPRDPGDVLGELLRAFGIRGDDVPPTLGERAALYRSTLTRRRMLVVLDDAASASQVRPLLPGTGASVVMVTSRARLSDLQATLSTVVGVLGQDEAGELLARIVGQARVRREPGPAARIVRLCGYLPLAIRIASARLIARPQWSLRLLADRLSDERRRLDELRVGDLSVRTNIASGYQSLSTTAARAVRLVGMLGPVTFPGWVLAALLDRGCADEVLDTLVESHLLEAVGEDAVGQPRYRMPELLRCFAEDRLSDEPQWVRRSAAHRVLCRYLDLAGHAVRSTPIRFFGVTGVEELTPGYQVAAKALAEHDPIAWFDAELHNVTAATRLAAELGMQDLGWRIAAVCAPFLELRGHHEEWRHTHEIALTCARQAEDGEGQAIILRNLAQLHLYQDSDIDAQSAFGESFRLFSESGNQRGAAIALAGLGTVKRIRGELPSARYRYERALTIFTKGRDLSGEAAARNSIGTVLIDQRRYRQAEQWVTAAYALAATIGDRHREAHTLQRLATIRQHQGVFASAAEHLGRATALFEELGDRHCALYARQAKGELCLRAGDLERAESLLTASLAAHRLSGDLRSEATVARLLGDLYRAKGHAMPAKTFVHEALSASRRLSSAQPPGTVEAVAGPVAE